jgi:hypothetical protein
LDLKLFMNVLWRFRILVAVGLLLATALAFLSFVRVSSAGLSYRASEQWVSYSKLLVTQPGFQWGDLLINSKDSANAGNALDAQRAAEERLSVVAVIYSNLVTSDAVKRIMLEDGQGPIKGALEAAALPISQNSNDLLPIVSIAGTATSPRDSLQLVARATHALKAYVEQQQRANGVPTNDRVLLQIVNEPGNLALVAPRKKTVPVVVFLTVMLAFVALAFILENVRPRVRAVREQDPLQLQRGEPARRNAS